MCDCISLIQIWFEKSIDDGKVEISLYDSLLLEETMSAQKREEDKLYGDLQKKIFDDPKEQTEWRKLADNKTIHVTHFSRHDQIQYSPMTLYSHGTFCISFVFSFIPLGSHCLKSNYSTISVVDSHISPLHI